MPFAISRLPLLVVLFLWAGASRAQTYVRVIDPEGTPSLHDLDWRDGALWATDTGADRVVRIDPATGAVSQPTPLSFDPRGVAWDGAAYRISTGFDTSDPRVFTVSPSGTTLGSVPAPSALTNGLTFFDGLLWGANAYPDAGASLVGVDPATGAVVETIPFPSTQPTGIAFLNDGTLWASNSGDDSGSSGLYRLYHLDRATGAVLNTLDAPEGTTRTRGLAYDAATNHLYVTVRTVATPQVSLVYEIRLATAGNAVAVVSPDAVDFGPVVSGQTATQTLTITNTGDAPLVLSNVAVTQSPEGGQFSTTLTDQSVAPGATLTATVSYQAADAGMTPGPSGELQFSTNDVTRPTVTIPLSGIPVFPDPTAQAVEASHDFGAVTVESGARTAAVWPLQLRNSGAAPLTVTSATTTDAAFGLYEADDLPVTIAPAAVVTLRLAFRPPAPGAYAGTVALASNDPASPLSVSLSGTGILADTVGIGGTLVWQHAVPDGPSPSTERKVSTLVSPGDLTGDGRPDLVYASRNYLTTVLDANSVVQQPGTPGPAVVWSFSSCPDNFNCGPVSGNLQLYETGMAAADLSGDGTPDIVIGTEGGNDHVYALDGRTGSLLWSVGSDSDPYLASYNSVSVRPGFDATGDGVPDVATGTGSASAQSPNPFNHRRVYLLNGASGALLWERQTALPNFRTVLFRTASGVRVASGGGEDNQTSLTAWRALDGSVAWSVSPGVTPFLAEPVPSAACAGCEDLLVGGGGAELVRVDGATGTVVWSLAGVGSSVWDVAVLERTGLAPIVVFGGSSSNVRAVDAVTAVPLWDANAGDQAFAVEAVPDSDGDGVPDVLVAGKDGVALLLSGATGEERWRYVFGDGTFARSGEAAAAVGDLDGDGAVEVAVGTRDGRVLLLRGAQAPVGGEAVPGTTPAALLALDAPFPNPTAGAVTLRYRLGTEASVHVAVVDALGRTVWTVAAGKQAAGSYALAGPTGLAAGLYTVRVTAGTHEAVQRLSVAR